MKKKRDDLAAQIQDVAEHLDRLRTHYFDIVSASKDEISVTLRPKDDKRPAGFRPRPR